MSFLRNVCLKVISLQIVFFVLPAQAEDYCEAAGNSSRYEWIKEVSLGESLHTSGASSYSHHQLSSFEVPLGESLQIRLTPGHPSGAAYEENWAVLSILTEMGISMIETNSFSAVRVLAQFQAVLLSLETH